MDSQPCQFFPALSELTNEIHLWLTFYEEIQDRDLISEYKGLMDQEEETRWRRFRFPKDQHRYLVSRALLRTTLSRYISIEPHQWRFSKNEYGKPGICNLSGIPLHFNLSHTDGLIICGIAKQDIGVDVENTERKELADDIAEKFFSSQEIKDLSNIPTAKKSHRFFSYWTLKESYIKARGMGLSMPLNVFTFHISDNEPLRISFSPKLCDNPSKWQFWMLELSPYHQGAISINREDNIDYRLTMKEAVPLKDDHDYFCKFIKSP